MDQKANVKRIGRKALSRQIARNKLSAQRKLMAKQIGGNIREIRSRLGWTIYQFAEASGLAASSLSQHETGHRFPQLHTLMRIAQVLKVSVQDLLKDCEGHVTCQ